MTPSALAVLACSSACSMTFLPFSSASALRALSVHWTSSSLPPAYRSKISNR